VVCIFSILGCEKTDLFFCFAEGFRVLNVLPKLLSEKVGGNGLV